MSTPLRNKKPTPANALPPMLTGNVAIDDGFEDPSSSVVGRVTVFGSKAKLYTWDKSSRGWEEYDTLTSFEAKIARDGVTTFVGHSKRLRDDVRIDDPTADQATWIVTPQGCQDCG